MSLAQGRQLLVECNILLTTCLLTSLLELSRRLCLISLHLSTFWRPWATCTWWEMVVYMREPTKTAYKLGSTFPEVVHMYVHMNLPTLMIMLFSFT